MATDDEVSKILGVLAAAYPGFNLRKDTVAIYSRLLADLDYPLLEQAALAVMTTNKFFPSIAELRQAVADISLEKRGIQDGMSAWQELMSTVGRYGHTLYGGDPPQFGNPSLQRTVAAMGWNDICLSEAPIEVLRAQFLKTYATYTERESREMQYLPETRRFAELRDPQEPNDVLTEVNRLSRALSDTTARRKP